MKKVIIFFILVSLFSCFKRDKEITPAQFALSTNLGDDIFPRFAVKDKYLFKLGNSEVVIYNNSSTPPVQLGTIPLGSDYDGVDELRIQENYLFMHFRFSDRYLLYDISNPVTPKYMNANLGMDRCNYFLVKNDILYITTNAECQGARNRLDMINLKTMKNVFYLMNSPRGLAAKDTVLYVCESDLGLTLLNIADTLNPKPITTLPEIKATTATLKEDILVLTSASFIYTLNCRNAIAPKLISKTPIN